MKWLAIAIKPLREVMMSMEHEKPLLGGEAPPRQENKRSVKWIDVSIQSQFSPTD